MSKNTVRKISKGKPRKGGSTTETASKTTTSSIIDELLPGFSQRSQRGRRNRQKGAEFERRVARVMQDFWGDARREHGQARDGGDAPDISGTPFWVECTKGTASVYDKLAQGAQDSTKWRQRWNGSTRDTPVVVVCSSPNNSSEIVVSLKLTDFLGIAIVAWGDMQKRIVR